MNWFNFYGLLSVFIILIPNVIFALKCRDGFVNSWRNKTVEALEQIGRFGCFLLMVFNIPGTYLGFWSDSALSIYLFVNAFLVGLYCLIWAICFKKSSLARAVALSVIPSVLFIFSGIMLRSYPLLIAALVFAPCHILISCKNAQCNKNAQ